MGKANRQSEIREEGPRLADPALQRERYPSRREHGSSTPIRGPETGGGFRAIGVAVSKFAVPIIARRGGGILVRLKTGWRAIVGPPWAELTWPTALGRTGVLKLRVGAAAALELQHQAPIVIERINLFFGRSVVSRLVIVQGPLPFVPPTSAPLVPSLSPAETEALDERLAGVANPELRAALIRLAIAVGGLED
jgi:hypothetical protein